MYFECISNVFPEAPAVNTRGLHAQPVVSVSELRLSFKLFQLDTGTFW